MPKKLPTEPRASRTFVNQTQAEAAELLGVSLRTWESWEGGQRNMPGQMMELYQHKAGIKRMPFRSFGYPRPGDDD